MHRVLVVCLALFCLSCTVLAQHEERVWTSASGKTVKGTFTGRAGDNVMLTLPDGRHTRIPFSRFSQEDQAVINGLSNTPAKAPTEPAPAKPPAKKATPPEAPVEVAKDTPKPEPQPAREKPRTATPDKQAGPVHELPFPYDKISPVIKCEENDHFSYHVFVPSTVGDAKAWPVMIVFDPSGGKAHTLKRYIPGAQLNGWALAVSIEASNNSGGDTEELGPAMIRDLLKRFPMDPKRIYSSGHSGGSRRAAKLGEIMRNEGFAGVLANGAGLGYERTYRQSSKSSVYALCGSNCYNRWDLPSSLKDMSCRNEKIVFFPGGHAWAGKEHFSDGITTLNGWFLSQARSKSSPYWQERDRYAERMLKEIETLSTTNPGKALTWATLLKTFMLPTPLAARVTKQWNTLRMNPEAKLYIAADAAMDRYINRYFTRKGASAFNYADPKATREGEKLAETYADTPFGEVFKRMAQPSVGG